MITVYSENTDYSNSYEDYSNAKGSDTKMVQYGYVFAVYLL